MKDYDLIVVGAGPGGYVSAIRAAQYGFKTAIVEKNRLGGTCLNRGCIPTKALLHAAGEYEKLAGLARLGITVKERGYDMGQIHARKREVVEHLVHGVEGLLTANGVDIITGEAKILSADEVQVGSDSYRASHVLIAVGSAPSRIPIPGIDAEGVITSDELLEGDPVDFQSLIIIGGGVIGVEMATVYSALGCKVTILEGMDRLIPNMDREFSQSLKMNFRKRGVDIVLKAYVTAIEESENGLRVIYAEKGSLKNVCAQGVLVSVGRKPQTAGLFAECATPVMDHGYIKVNERFESSIPGIYAIGDVIGGIQLAHKAEAEGLACAAYLAGRDPDTNVKVVPSCIYTSPEIASVGLTAEEARERGIEVRKSKYLMSGNGKSIIEGEERGFIKTVFDAETDRLLGVQMMCGRATDLISEFTAAVVNGYTREQLLSGMRPHPSFCEGITEALEAVNGMSIHSIPVKK